MSQPINQSEDLYPNEGAYVGGVPSEPAEQAVERKKEKANTLQALPILEALIERLEQRIEFYGSVDAMPKELKTQPTKFMNMHNANEQTRENLRQEKELIESLIDEHFKSKR